MAVILTLFYFLQCHRMHRSSAVATRLGKEEISSFMSTAREVLRYPALPSCSARPPGKARPTCCYTTGFTGSSAAHLAIGQRLAGGPRDPLSHQSEGEGRGGCGVLDTFVLSTCMLCTGEAMSGYGHWRKITQCKIMTPVCVPLAIGV